jgi:integrase
MQVRRQTREGDTTREVKTLTAEERELIIDHVDKEWGEDVHGQVDPARMTVRVLLHSGLRSAEWAHMEPDWMVTEDGEPMIKVQRVDCDCKYCKKQSRQKALRNDEVTEGEDGFDEYVERELRTMWHPKSEAGSRHAAVYDDETWELLKRFMEERGGRSFVPDTVWYRVNKINEDFDEDKHDFAGNVTPHTLRHSHATALAEAGIGIDEIRQQLGHASTQSTQIYMNEPAGSRAKRTREQYREAHE